MKRFETRPLPRRRDRGFTFVELFVAMSIMGILAITVPTMMGGARNFENMGYARQKAYGNASRAVNTLVELLRPSAELLRPFWPIGDTTANANPGNLGQTVSPVIGGPYLRWNDKRADPVTKVENGIRRAYRDANNQIVLHYVTGPLVGKSFVLARGVTFFQVTFGAPANANWPGSNVLDPATYVKITVTAQGTEGSATRSATVVGAAFLRDEAAN